MNRESAKRGLLAAAAVVFTLIALEGVISAAFYLREGRVVPIAERERAEDQLLAGQFNPQSLTASGGQCLWGDQFAFHPYLGYVFHRLPPCAAAGVNNKGFHGPDYPLERKPGTFVIMLAGGSVAMNQVGATPGENLLQQELNAHYTGNGIDQFIVISGAQGGWKQPQAFIAFALYSGILDGIITLDGYNERTQFMPFPNQEFEAPSNSHILGGLSGLMDWRAIFFSYLDGALYREQRSSALFRHSNLAYFLSTRFRAKFRELAIRRNGESIYDDYAFPSDFPRERRQAYNLSQYHRYVQMMDAVSRRLGIKRLFLIQPVPALEKELTAQEKSLVGDLGYRDDYAGFEKSLLGLRAEQVPVESLVGIFRDARQTLYGDPIHLNFEGRTLINRAIVNRLEKSWGLKRSR